MGLSHPTDPNIYLIDGGGIYAMVDAGSGLSPNLIIRNLEKDKLQPNRIEYIILTHSHWDHARGSAYLKELSKAKLLVHELGIHTLEKELWPEGLLAQKGIQARPTKVDIEIRDGNSLQVGSAQLTFYHTPGHSLDSVCILMEDEGKIVLFSGDTVFAEGLPGAINADTNFANYRDSLAKLRELKCDILLPGHKLFLLANGSEHVELLADKFSAGWKDFVLGPTPFFPSWWLKHRPSLYEDASLR